MDRLPRDVLVEHILTPCLYDAWHDLQGTLTRPQEVDAFRHIVFGLPTQVDPSTHMEISTWTAMRTRLAHRTPAFPHGRTIALMLVCKRWHATLTLSNYAPLRWHWTLCTLLCVYDWTARGHASLAHEPERCYESLDAILYPLPIAWVAIPRRASHWKDHNGYPRWRKHVAKRSNKYLLFEQEQS